MNDKIAADLKDKLTKKLNFELEKFEEIHKGLSNKLFTLISDQGEKLLLKIYYSKNDQNLHREFHALTFLNKRGLPHIPKAYFKNDELNYAIYSYEQGEGKNILDVTREDIDQIVTFLTSVHNINDPILYEEFSGTIMKRLSFNDYIHNITLRVDSFSQYATSDDVNPKIKALASKTDFPKLIAGLILKTTKHLSQDELNHPLDLHLLRLSPADFGPHNMIWREDGLITFLDFEYCGLDDPIRVVSEFIVHDQSYAISDSLKHYFLDQYKEKVNIPEIMFERINILIKLFYIEWISFFLNSITPKGFEQIQFSVSNFDIDEHIDKQIAKIHQRIKDLDKFDKDYL